MGKIHRALISVTDKTGLESFAKGLSELGVEILSTGGTAKLLRQANIQVKDVSDITGFPEMLDGRVKTIHPRIAGGILAMREKSDHMQSLSEHEIPLIDMVVVNLYEFAKIASTPGATLEDMIENIDIGGPTLIRAAAKNYQDVAVVTSADDYGELLSELNQKGELTLQTHWELAKKAFATTASYDRAINMRLAQITLESEEAKDEASALPPFLDVSVPRRMGLRYGENPHQMAALYGAGNKGIAGALQLHGKELSYNNLVDLDAAWQLIEEFENPAAAIIKHTNPCGCAEHDSLLSAYLAAYEADPVSAFGGIIALNREVDEGTAEELSKLFVEAIAAPKFSTEALMLLKQKKNLRLLQVLAEDAGMQVRSISGGFLVQTADLHRLDRRRAQIVTEREPTEDEWAALEFNWKVCKHVKSNAIVYGRAGQVVAVGAGQMSRVDSVKVGAMKSLLPLDGCVIASDAFFPFPDGIREAAQHGISAVIQPGGSVKDSEAIAAANELDLAMVFTGVRHFKH
jgi:phosphoribosylaminoimidazolecarboxamide formyltransferase / IMP cyclohydrolase